MSTGLLKPTFLFILPLFAFVYTDWVTQKIDEKVTISFPGKPEALSFKSSPAWRYTSDSALIIAFSGSNVVQGKEFSKEDFENPGTLKSFADGITESFKGSRVLSSKRSIVSGYPSYEILLEIGTGVNTKKMYTQTVFVGAKMFGLYYYELGRSQPIGRQHFFGSFVTDKN